MRRTWPGGVRRARKSLPGMEGRAKGEKMNLEVNGIRIGNWEIDVFITDDGNLGLTVYEYGKTGNDKDIHAVDIFVKKDLKVTYC
jgi:hypothetical protein